MSALVNTLCELKADQTGDPATELTVWEFATFLLGIVVVGTVVWWQIALWPL